MVKDAEFSYEEFVTRNIGFVSLAEQARLRNAKVFVCGVGGMGGACVHTLARAGVGRLILADRDTFEVSNLNRQVFATLGTIGLPKVEASRDALLRINPELEIEIAAPEWTKDLWNILRDCDVVVNGMDDLGAAVELYRAARAHGVTVIDAYTATLPNVFTTKPTDPCPEERFSCGSQGLPLSAVTPEMLDRLKRRELEFVLTHSSTREHIDARIAAEMISGKRSRISFAPMVLATGELFAYEVIGALLGKPSAAGYLGYFFNPHNGTIERPRLGALALAKGFAVRLFLERLGHE